MLAGTPLRPGAPRDSPCSFTDLRSGVSSFSRPAVLGPAALLLSNLGKCSRTSMAQEDSTARDVDVLTHSDALHGAGKTQARGAATAASLQV